MQKKYFICDFSYIKKNNEKTDIVFNGIYNIKNNNKYFLIKYLLTDF